MTEAKPITVIDIPFTLDEAKIRRDLRARWTITEHPDGWGVAHVEAGEFGHFVDGKHCPFRHASKADAEAWLDAVLDDTQDMISAPGTRLSAPLTPEEQAAVDAAETEEGEETR